MRRLYLQLLAWVHAVFLASQLGSNVSPALEVLGAHFDKASDIKLTLGVALDSARTLAQRVEQVGASKSNWAHRLMTAWTSSPVWKLTDYDRLEDVVEQRNRKAHRETYTREEAQRIIDRRSRLILALCRALGEDAELPRLVAADDPIDEEGRLQAAVIRWPDGSVFKAGPLLACAPDDAAVTYVPHSLDRATLLARPLVDRRPSTFVRYGAARIGTTLLDEFRVRLVQPPPMA